MEVLAPNVRRDICEKIVSFCCSITAETANAQNLPDFPSESIAYVAQMLNTNPKMSIFKAIQCLYPFNAFQSKEISSSLKTLFKELGIPTTTTTQSNQNISAEVAKINTGTQHNEFIGRKFLLSVAVALVFQ